MRFLRQHQAGGQTKRLLAMTASMMAVAAVAFSPGASAASHHPKGEFAQFSECPLNNPAVETCVFSLSKGGSFTIGKKVVPLKNPVTLQGGAIGGGSETQFVGAENGQTLSKTPQPVPGGLLGITAPTWWPGFVQVWFNNLINEGLTGVNATVELAKPASAITLNTENLIFEEGVALGLPAKIHLENSILGSSCYIGSSSTPVQINFTTGTTAPPPPNKPIKGAAGEAKFNEEDSLVTFKGGKLVDNAFAAPEATGCGGIFAIFVDPLVNSILGTPSAAGTNSAILEGELKAATASVVKASE